MIIVYLLILFVFLLKKYLDKQSERSYVQGHFLQEEKINDESKYDSYCHEHFELLRKSLILCTYNAEKFSSIPYVDSPFRGLGDDLEYVFSKPHFESIFRNNLISETFKPKLLHFKDAVFKINDEEWGFESVDLNHDQRWKEINTIAEELLSEMQIKERSYNFELGQPQ